MKALSVRQPWAWLIVAGYKDIENRKWRTNYRGRILIHTGGRMADDAGVAYRLARKLGIRIPAMLPANAIVGAVDITDCVTASDIPWFSGPYGFALANPVQVVPIPQRGHQMSQLNPFVECLPAQQRPAPDASTAAAEVLLS